MADAARGVVDANAIAIQTIASQQSAIESLQSLVQTLKEQIAVLSRNAASEAGSTLAATQQHNNSESEEERQQQKPCKDTEDDPLGDVRGKAAPAAAEEGTGSTQEDDEDAKPEADREAVQELQEQVAGLSAQLARQQREARATERRWSEDKARLRLLETFVFQQEGQLRRLREELAAVTLEKKRWKVLADALTTHVPSSLQSHVQDYMRHMLGEEKERAQAAAAAEAKAAAAATILSSSHNLVRSHNNNNNDDDEGDVSEAEHTAAAAAAAAPSEAEAPLDALDVLSVWNSKVGHLERGNLALLTHAGGAQAATGVTAEDHVHTNTRTTTVQPCLPRLARSNAEAGGAAARTAYRTVSPSQGPTMSSKSYSRAGRPSHGKSHSRFLVPM